MHSVTCTHDGCERHAVARNLCAPHYSYWHREQKRYTVTCSHCGTEANVARKPRGNGGAYCGRACASRAAQAQASSVRTEQMREKRNDSRLRQCEWCTKLHASPTAKMCSADCRTASAEARRREMLSPLRRAIEDADHQATLAQVRSRVSIDANGCWNWTGARSNVRKGGPYPTYRDWHMHRVVLEAKLGAPLGKQTAHHICSNTMCVNPEHLQQATCRENVAEMLARNDYVRRITVLEQELGRLAPEHPLLTEAPLAGVLRQAS